MQVIKEKLGSDEVVEKLIKDILKSLNIRSKVVKWNIIHIPKIRLHILEYLIAFCFYVKRK